MKLVHEHLFEVLQLIYLKGCGIGGTAAELRRAESTIHGNLGQADAWLASWFTDRKRRQAEQLAERERVQAGQKAPLVKGVSQ
jgi:hypothetical protein